MCRFPDTLRSRLLFLVVLEVEKRTYLPVRVSKTANCASDSTAFTKPTIRCCFWKKKLSCMTMPSASKRDQLHIGSQ